jgi:hypothetical protein
MTRAGDCTPSKAEWIRRATLRLLSRNQEISAWDAVVVATVVAQGCVCTATVPESNADSPRSDASSPRPLNAWSEAWPHASSGG